jgi:Kef-type K+ transport system membrane component KefB
MELVLELILLLVSAKLAGEAFERMKQPAVLGELLAGIILGKTLFDVVHTGEVISFLAEIGLVLLLFEVGLESDLADLVRVGKTSFLVAAIGVAAPFILGYTLSLLLGFDQLTALFMGSALTATSVGISARVLFDLGKLTSNEGKIIVGAAVFDDVLGLLFFSVVASAASVGSVSYSEIGWIVLKAILFFSAMIFLGIKTAPFLLRIVTGMRVRGVFVVSGFIFSLFLAYITNAIGLSTIIGAFMAGLILPKTEHKFQLATLIKPVADIFVPIFFVIIGIAIDIRVLLRVDVIFIALLFFGVAVVGKIISGIAATNSNRLVIGVGMVPRGEVGLVFASFGLSLAIIDDVLYSSLLAIVVFTTVLAPILLRKMFK